MSISSPTPTSSSTSFSTPVATVTNLLALTTPFFQKPECASIWTLSHVSTHDTNGVATTVAFLASDVDDERFTSCQPSGWGSVVPASRFSFSPAVCPSDWTYYSMASTYHEGITFTTAYCCAGGFALGSGFPDSPYLTTGVPCLRDAAGDVSTAGTLLDQVHEAWHISWAASDTSSLSPALPEITSDMHVDTWVPGQTITPGMYDNTRYRHDGPQIPKSAFWFLVVGVVDSQGK
ncbi:hypothetical protein VE04_09274 [Pseudogymnoascus sp. 24MN13]|nr:hypothetical protein VE04_09274 [Pseudogymnoascus sp. 24MN13]